MISLRLAQVDQADEIATLLRRSITELCEPDHRNDAARIAAWVANKTPETVQGWIAHEHLSVIVADIGGAIAGVGAVSKNGEVLLLYVHPDHRFIGVSDALLEYMVSNYGACFLTSTLTARLFYAKRGWIKAGETGSGGVPMRLPR